nr:hypothetical protein [Tanacetum cinerariifolium]
MTGNISYLLDYEPLDRGYVSFSQGGCKITGKGTIKSDKLEFKNVYFVKDLKYNLFSVSQIYDNKNSVLFTDSECIVLGKIFKLTDDTNVLLRTPSQHNMYSIDLNNVVPYKDLTCLVAKASLDESMLWHRRLGHLNFKTMNRNFITEIENMKDLKVKIIRCDNGGEFRNKEINDLCSRKRIKREFSNARTPQQNEAEAVNTACYVQNMVLVNKSQNKTPYELFNGRTPAIGFLKPFRCHVMILNTLDHLGKFEAKGDEGYFIGYSMSSKAFRVFNKRTKKVEENLHVDFLENKAIEKGINSTNFLGTKDAASQEVKKYVNAQDTCNADTPESSGNPNPTATTTNPLADQMETLTVETPIPTISSPVLTACFEDSPELKFDDILRATTSIVDSHGKEADVSNMEITITCSPTPTLRIHKDHLKSQIIGPVDTLIQTRNKLKEMEEHSFIATIHQKTNPALLQFCLFSCFLSQVEPKKIFDALQDPSWVEAMQEELLQFKIQNVWSLVDCPKGVRPIGTEWVLKNKKDERGIVIKNKSRLVAQRHTQEEGIDYDEVFSHVAKIKAIRLFLAYASFMGFTIYQMDVKSAFLYGTIDKEVGTIDQILFIRRQRGDFILVQVYVDDIIFGSSNPQLCREFEAIMHEKFQMSAMDVRLANTPMDKENPWGKDGTGKDVDLYLYRSMIGSLMYLTGSRPYIKFTICACARHQVTPKECHLHAVKRIFRYLKGHPKLGLWYPKESPFDLVAYLDSDYGGATQDHKSTTGGCQFLGRRLISWQCKKQTIVATSTTKAEYVAAASGCRQVMWIQNQLLDYGVFLGFGLTFAGTSKYWGVLRILMISLRLIPLELQLSPHHTPSPEAQQRSPTTHSSPSLPPVTTEPLPTVIPSDTPQLRQYTRRAKIAQSSVLPPIVDEPASPIGDDSQGKACLTVFGLKVEHDMENITKTSTLPSDLTPKVTSLAADEGLGGRLLALLFSEANVLHVSWISFGHCVTSRGHLC